MYAKDDTIIVGTRRHFIHVIDFSTYEKTLNYKLIPKLSISSEHDCLLTSVTFLDKILVSGKF